ncbi:MAG: chromate transporter [Ktedonobacteraceae bacterium]|nr:chromate transporter [Ktedonobacteraceae bacterium]
MMFGGGVVAIPLFQQELVQTYHWLTPQQFLDGVAIGQLTPGLLTVVATFAGYAVAGSPGALVATVAMLPSLVCAHVGSHPASDALSSCICSAGNAPGDHGRGIRSDGSDRNPHRTSRHHQPMASAASR